MTKWLYRLGRGSVRHRYRVIAGWVLVAVCASLASLTLGGDLVDRLAVPGSEAQRAVDVLDERFPATAGGSAQLVFQAPGGTLDDPAPAAAVAAALADVRSQPHVERIGDLHLSADATIGYADVQYTQPAPEIRDEAYERLTAVAERAADDGLRLELGGELPSQAEDPRPSGQEVIGLVAAVVVLLLAFGSVIAMGLPIGTALLGLATSVGLIGITAAVTEVSEIALTLAVMIGLGVGIDYALFIVTRHREHLRAGMTVEESAGRAIATSGAAVLFAALTVVIALSGLAIVGMPVITAMGLMAGVAVLVMAAVSLTLLPALLGLAGHRINSLRLPGINRGAAPGAGRETRWHRYGRRVTARPWPWLLIGVGVLVVLTVPFFSMHLGMTDAGVNQESTSNRQAYDLVAEDFGAGFNG
ncbi:MAG: MMPL family transporter, partial [Actinomycetota bacterium]|nr:MMPL family transporter [Actinomycetota bacterium]